MKNAPIKILIVIIITSVICICSELLISNQLDELCSSHENIMDEHVTNREYMANINKLLYEHQAIIVNYMVAQDDQVKADYLDKEESMREQLKSIIVSFSYRMKGGKREQVYHKVYSDFAAYIHNSDMFLDFCKNDDMDMALYYNDNVLKPFLDDIDMNIYQLELMTSDEIAVAEMEIQNLKEYSEFARYSIMVILIGFLCICTFICVSITHSLDKYKQNLELEIIEKNKSIQEKNENLIKLQDGIIIGMANLIESRDGETGEHVKRTSAIVEMVALKAREMGIYADELTDEYIERLKKAAPLHDVGKITVKDSILMKPGKLTVEEFEEIKKHAPMGGKIIRECFADVAEKTFVDMACDVASGHHEKWDGSGYMQGRSGEDIPLSARIMTIADVFDALVSKRCYKEALTVDEAYEIIVADSGKHFDPNLVKVFVSLREDINKYMER